MIDKFSTVYAGHVDLGDMGQQARQRAPVLQRPPGVRLREDRGDRALHG